MVRKQAVPHGYLWLDLQDPGGRWGRGGPEHRALPSAPSGLAEDKEKRVQAGRGGAHTLTCIPGVAQVTQRAQTGIVDRQGDVQTGHACGHTCMLPRWGSHQHRSARHHPPHPQALTGGLPSRGCPVLLETPSAGTGWATEGRREPRAPPGSPGSRTPGSGVPKIRTPGSRVPWEQVKGTDCTGGPVVLGQGRLTSFMLLPGLQTLSSHVLTVPKLGRV